MLKNKYSGKFIVFEGLDGSGQSTQVQLLADFLKNKIIITKEPRKNNKLLRKILDKKQKLEPKKLQQAFAQDRKEHLEQEIIPALKQGKTVICDRYVFSSLAYGQADGVDLKYLLELNKDFLMPDIVYFLDVKPGVCLNRIIKRGIKKTLFEKQKVFEKVYKNFKNLSKIKKFNFKIINGEKNINEVFEQIRAHSSAG